MRDQIGGDQVQYDEGTVRGVVQGVQKKRRGRLPLTQLVAVVVRVAVVVIVVVVNE